MLRLDRRAGLSAGVSPFSRLIRRKWAPRRDAGPVIVVSVLMVVVAYLVGTLPSAHVVAGRRGLDPTKEGSGNPGATNVYRVVGRRAGLIVFAADLGKGAVATAMGLAVDGRPLATACWAAVTLGHVLPITRRLRGGKGVATGGGGAMVLFPLQAVACAAVFFLVARLTRKASLGSLTMAVVLPILVAWAGAPPVEILAAVGLALLVVVRHRSNIQRMLDGGEGTWSAGG